MKKGTKKRKVVKIKKKKKKKIGRGKFLNKKNGPRDKKKKKR